MSYQNEKIVKLLLENIFINKDLEIGGVVDYDSFSSNIIKFSTQSIFSHINFFDSKSMCAIWSENLKWVTAVDYSKNNSNEFYYVTKKISLDYIKEIFNFDYIRKVFLSIWKLDESNKNMFQKRYKQYLKLRKHNSKYKTFQLLYENNFDYDKLWISVNKIDNLNTKYLDEFLIMWIVKFIHKNLWKNYDLWSTLGIGFTPWINYNSGNNHYFCSEFVAEALLYAGIYPFDIKTKDPNSITPWDLVDLSHIYNDRQTVLYKIDKSWINKILDFKEKNKEVNIKDFIISREIESLYFRFDYMKISLFRNFMKTSLSWNKKISYKTFSILLYFFFWWYAFVYLAWQTNSINMFSANMSFLNKININELIWLFNSFLFYSILFFSIIIWVFYSIAFLMAVFNKEQIVNKFHWISD